MSASAFCGGMFGNNQWIIGPMILDVRWTESASPEPEKIRIIQRMTGNQYRAKDSMPDTQTGNPLVVPLARNSWACLAVGVRTIMLYDLDYADVSGLSASARPEGSLPRW